MAITITAPATRGTTVEIVGDKVGRFLVHKDIGGRVLSNGDFIEGYSVSLIENGIRFPWVFPTKRQAKEFSRGVEALIPWDRVEVRLPAGNEQTDPKVKWLTAPSREQSAATVQFAKECGAKR